MNHRWIAVKWSGRKLNILEEKKKVADNNNKKDGGSIGLLPLDKPGKACSNNARVFHAHGASLSDWCFSEFDDSLLATGAEDGLVRRIQVLYISDHSPQLL